MKNKKTFLTLLFLALFTILLQGQTIKLKIKVSKVFPVGWGILYKGSIEEITEGNKQIFKDSLEFGITASRKFEYLKSKDIRIITLTNSKEKNKFTYLPAIDGTVSKQNEIWHITKIEK